MIHLLSPGIAIVVLGFNICWSLMARSYNKPMLLFYNPKEMGWLTVPFYLYTIYGIINLLPLFV